MTPPLASHDEFTLALKPWDLRLRDPGPDCLDDALRVPPHAAAQSIGRVKFGQDAQRAQKPGRTGTG